MADEIRCKNCGAEISVGEDVGLVGYGDNPEEMHIVCMICHEAGDVSNIAELNGGKSNYSSQPPIIGQFQPCKSAEQISELRTKSYYARFWVSLEEDLLGLLNEYGDKFLRFSLSSRTFKGYRFEFVWEQGKIVRLTFPGHTSKTQPPMSIYQVHRLRQMGLMGEGENPREWKLKVSGAESSFENIVRILTHILEFGYMIDVSRIDAVTPTVDL